MPSSPRFRFVLRACRCALPLTLCLLTLFGAGCSSLRPAPPLTQRLAVLDFRTPPSMVENPTTVEGWWLGARTVFQNPQAGDLVADTLSYRLADLPYIEQIPRDEIDRYMARKRSLLVDVFTDLAPEDYDRLLLEVGPVDYGTELGVDYVLSGRVIECYTSEHRTWHTWHSYIKIETELWDMATGQAVWSRVFEEKDAFRNQIETMEHLAPEVVGALDRTYFQRQNR